MDPENVKAFKDTSLGDILEEAHNRSNEQKKLVERLIDQLSDFMETEDDAVALVPLIKEYLEINVQNNEQLVKIAQVVQRMYNTAIKQEGKDDGGGGFSDDERDELRSIAENMSEAEAEAMIEEAEATIDDLDKDEELDL